MSRIGKKPIPVPDGVTVEIRPGSVAVHGPKGDTHDTLVVTLRYGPSRERVISGLKRVSRPGRRVYAKKDRPHRVLGGMGVAILSTSSGVITGRQAQEQGVGGEVVCYVW